MITAIILDKNLDPIVGCDDFLIVDDDFSEIEKIALSPPTIYCIRWIRTSDGQVAYWSPRGASVVPYWYGKATPD